MNLSAGALSSVVVMMAGQGCMLVNAMLGKGEELIKGALRSIAASVPGAASLVQLWNEYETLQQNQRVSVFFQLLEDELKRVTIRVQEAENAARSFPVLLERAVEYSRRTDSSTKHRAFARALAGLVEATHPNPDDCYAVLETLDSLTDLDAHVLNLFFDELVSARSVEEVEQYIRELTLDSSSFLKLFMDGLRAQSGSVDSADSISDSLTSIFANQTLIVSIAKLESRGLLEDCTPFETVDYDVLYERAPPKPRWKRRQMRLTSFGRRLRELLASKLADSQRNDEVPS